MENIVFEKHYITPDGFVFNSETGLKINDLSYKRVGLFYNISGQSEDLCVTIGKHLFGFINSYCKTVEFGHIDNCWVNNNFCNIKIYNKKDPNNRSNNFIAFHEGDKWFFEKGIPKHPSVNLFLELNIT